LKYLKILFIFFIFFAKTYAENIDKFEPKSHFWLYFIIVFFWLVITFYFYSKTKYIEKNKKNAMYSLILLLSL
jgi:1-acyl-sn-glycerol-3-phosphate acyltransferase